MSPSKRQRPTTGKGKGAGASTPSSGPAPKQRLGLLVFGVTFVILFAGFAIEQGIGDPSVPAGAVAIVEDAPGDLGTITKEQFDKALAQTASQAGTTKVPKPGDNQYDEIMETALGGLIDAIWLQGEAAEVGITVTPKQIADEFETIKEQNFPTKKAYAEFLKSSNLDQSEVDERVKLQIISTELQKQIGENAPAVAGDSVEAYYEESKIQFTEPPTRDVRVVLNKSKAKAEQAKALLEKDDSPASWTKVAKKYSTDSATKGKGGLTEGLAEGTLEEPLNEAVFEAANSQVEGPVKNANGYYIFEIDKVTPEKVQPLSAVRAQITSQLEQQAQQEAFSAIIASYTGKWTSRTFCASGFEIERCANFEGSGRLASAPPACYEADPKGGLPEACPAPVGLLAPALPGSVSIVTPKGEPLQQRPQPEGLEDSAGAGAVPGTMPEGVPPPAEAPPSEN